MKKFSKRFKASCKETTKLLLITLAVFILVNVFIGELMVISGSSMEPNFHDHEQLFSEKITYRFGTPKRGDVVVVKHPQEPNKLVIKRIIGLPGETLLISHTQVFIDSTKLEETYLSEDVVTVGKKVIATGINYPIPEDSYVVLGDNRSDSIDSREWGPVSEKNIVSRVLIVYFPVSELRLVNF